MPDNRLVQALEARRQSEGMTARAFAEALGINETTYSRLRKGSLLPGRVVIEGALRRFPELASVLTDPDERAS